MNDTYNTEELVPVVDATEATLAPDAGAGEAAQSEGTVFVAEDNEAVSVAYDA
jgi:hypothetical protein